jgi:hypothetical protein
MNKQISQILEIDEVEFENLQTERYLRWCMNIEKTKSIPLQSVIANAAINKYYNREFSKLESKFLNLIDGKEKFIGKEALYKMYNIIVVDMFKYYPNPLIDAARNINIVNPPFYAN